MRIAKGVSLGPYEIVSHLGSGGMGEVWRARDPRIRRDVAIKVLPQEFATSEEQLQRFEQEARAAGALNHPGLVTIFDVGRTSGGAPYIVMELLEGQTLRDVLGDPDPSPLPLRKAIDYASQIAAALAVAHGNGIIHRDLKPENLFVTSDRRVKILDFGLAKLAPSTDSDGKRRTSRHLTGAGIAVGTPAYMSPEQVRASPIDHRTDIFCLGLVLYEMITGRLAFERGSVIETMHAVLNEEPPPIEIPISPALEETLRYCLEKDPRERFQSARDLAIHLQTLPEMQRNGSGFSRELAPLPQRRLPLRQILVGGSLLLALAAGGLAWHGLNGNTPSAMPRVYRQVTSTDGVETFPTLSPDGEEVAFVSSQAGNRDIYVQRVDGRMAINITADSLADESEPAFSPDGAKIAFRSERDGGGIFVMGATGDSPLRLTDFGHNPTWSPDGTQIAFATEEVELVPAARVRSSELWVVDVRTGASRPLVQKGKGGPDFGPDSDAVQPSWSPNGHRIAFWGISSRAGQYDLWTVDPAAPEPKKTVIKVTTGTAMHWNPVWSPDGEYLYFGSDADGTMNLWRIAMDEETGKPAGVPEPVSVPAAVAGNFAVAKSGQLAYVAVSSSYRVLAMPFDVHAGTIGQPRQLLGGSHDIIAYQPSPDGKMIAYQVHSGTQEDIFVAEADGTRIRQLTNDPAVDRSVHWAPDGKTLYFHSTREGASRIWSVRADGSGLRPVSNDADAKAVGARELYQPTPSPDGRTLLVQTDRETSALLHLDRPAGKRVEPLPAFLPTPKWSPDGQFIVARDRRVMSPQIVRKTDFPGAIILYSLATRRAEKLANGGLWPHWTPDGRKVVYFKRQEIHVLDVASRDVKVVPFASIAGVQVDLRDGSRLSRDAETVYVRQAIQQGDVWLVTFRDGAVAAKK